MTESSAYDTIDTLLDLKPGLMTHSTRHQREKVVQATQGSEDGLFDPQLPGLSVTERLLAALLACQLTPATALAKVYQSRLEQAQADPVTVQQVLRGDLTQINVPRLKAILLFTHILITDPVRADKHALTALKDAGLSTPEVVTLAQLIAFVSYQVRLAAGLNAMKALEQQA
jgi:uncharacterized protein YciW